MRSALTPRILRRILRSEAIVHRDCTRRQIIAHGSQRTWTPQQHRRSLFGWISPVPREAMVATGEKASLKYLKDACSRLDNRIRAPPSDSLAKAWTGFVQEKAARKAHFNDFEANYVRRVLEHLRAEEPDRFEEMIPFESLRQAQLCISSRQGAVVSDGAREACVECSTTIFDEMKARMSKDHRVVEQAAENGPKRSGYRACTVDNIWHDHLAVLASCGSLAEAKELVSSPDFPADSRERAWIRIVNAFARAPEVDSGSVASVVQQLEQAAIMTPRLRLHLAAALAMKGEERVGRRLLGMEQGEILQNVELEESACSMLLKGCRRNGLISWGQDLIKAMSNNVEAMQQKSWIANLMLQWALGTGKSVDDLHRMLEVMEKTIPEYRPGSGLINGLISIANEKRDPYLAERIVGLGQNWAIEPNSETYQLQMDYRLAVDDVEGARKAFELAIEVSESKTELAPQVNRLVQAMCEKDQYSFDDIMVVVEHMSTSSMPFEPGTVARLAVLHLQRDEYNDVADLLSSNMQEFTLEDRSFVRKAMRDFMLDENTELSRLWDSYMIFQHVFEEAPRADRIAIMERFFAKERPDMAVHVFNHMRQHANENIKPDAETYVTALIGAGRAMDDEALETVNNVLKLDIHVQETTRLHNARVIAYFEAGESERAQAVWEDIIRSDEGPSLQSIALVLRICEQSAFGDVRAKSIWSLIKKMDIEINDAIVAAYAGALAGNGYLDEAMKVVETCEAEFGVEVTDLVLAKLYNGANSKAKQDLTQAWIESRYPESWARLDRLERKGRYYGGVWLDLDITMEP